jgi:4-carboxymuconolactone decarboxylase
MLGLMGKVVILNTEHISSTFDSIRPGLERKQRSLLNIGILMTLNRGPELRAHIRGAINNGLTETEISEAIRHTMIYSGVPSGVDAFKIAGAVIKEMKEEAKSPAN